MIEEFEGWAKSVWEISSVTGPEMSAALEAWEARQPEIDALKAEIACHLFDIENRAIREDRLKAALAAAPTPPATIAWPPECKELCKAVEGMQRAVNELWKAENPDELQDGETAMSEEEARELHSERWKALDSAIYYMRKRMSAPPAQESDLSQEARDWHAKRRSAREPAQEDEPVLWLCDFDDQTWYAPNKEGADRYKAEGATVTPLYTSPDNSELRKAAEELINTFDRVKCLESRYGPCPVIESLRAALEGK